MNQSFLFELIGVFTVHWLILEPQTYVVVEQFGAENIPLLSGRLVSKFCLNSTLYSILNIILRFTKEETEVRKQAFPFVPARYIRTFDVISEVNCVFVRRKRSFEKIALYPNFDVISEVNCVLPRRW